MITVDFPNRIINSDASILDVEAFKDDLRLLEASVTGVLYPPILTYKFVDIGGGAVEHFVDIINNYQLRFPVAGDYEIIGQINGDIIHVDGVFVERTKAVAFAILESTELGLSEEDAGKIDANLRYVKDIALNMQPH